MTADQIEKLKALALAATPGEWRLAENGWIDGPEDDTYVVQYEGCGSHSAEWDENDLKFVLGCNPATVLELIAEVERLRAELACRGRAQGGDTSLEGITRYRMLEDGELIGMDDEFLSYDGTYWNHVRAWSHPTGSWVGTPFNSEKFQPTRRKVTGKVAQVLDSSAEAMDHTQLQALGQHQEKS